MFFSVRTVPDDLNETPCKDRLKEGLGCFSSYERAVPTSEQQLHFFFRLAITMGRDIIRKKYEYLYDFFVISILNLPV